MYLKSMELFGFKSFADRTLVKFGQGITAIVGPNGCGKSNVVDAIKWVLGEKSARNIRGDKMEDVIFSGTDQRKAVSLAEVSLTIDNSKKILDFDSDSVTIGRRIFRDGESEYLLNKSPVRLKDIEKLLMDTGIGKSAYSVMEQGKMDLILSTSAEDRRYIFEEAAGISRYKHQKKESLKKLQDTGANLERINDIINEIEREKEFKRKQAEKTRIYIDYMKKYSDFDIRLNVIKHRDILKRQEKIQEDIERLMREREAISAKVASISSENEKDEKRKNDIQNNLWELDKELSGYRFRLEDIDVKTDKNRRLIEDQKKQIELIEKKIEERSSSMAGLAQEKLKAEQTGIEIRKKIDNDREKLKSFAESKKRKIESIKNSKEKIESNRKLIRKRDDDQKSMRDELEVVIKRLIDAIDKRKAELSGSEDERQALRGKIHSSIEGIGGALRAAMDLLKNGSVNEALNLLQPLDMQSLYGDIVRFESFEDGFRSILFDKTGIHAKKEELDGRIAAEERAIDELLAENIMLERRIQDDQSELEDINGMITRVEISLSTNETDSDWIERSISSYDYQIKDILKQIENHRDDIERSRTAIRNFTKEIEEWETKLIEFNERSNALILNISDHTSTRDEIERKIHDRKSISRKDEEDLRKIVERITSMDKNLVEFIFRRNNIEEYIWNEYEMKPASLARYDSDSSQTGAITGEIQELKKKIQDLGPINNLAIEEYNDLKKRFEYYITQRNDIEKARKDILSVIDDINKTSIDLFLDTFTSIRKNFSEIFKQLFEGGDAAIEIMDPGNVLESGIDIMVRPPGKKLKSINLLSGGERALTAIALLFATYMAKPSPFCFLDEIDAPLDEENIRRFVKMLREFSKSTQFIIVTHNKNTLSTSEAVYGVTMEEPGISKVLSLNLKRGDGKAAQETVSL